MDWHNGLFNRDRIKRLIHCIVSSLQKTFFFTVTIAIMFTATSAQSTPPSLDKVFKTYHNYDNPVQTIQLLRKKIENHLPGDKLDTDFNYLQLSNLYSSLGNHDEATSLLFKLKLRHSSNDIEKITYVLYGLEWAATHKEKRETRDEIASLALALHYAPLIENLSWRQTALWHVKEYQFNFLVEHALEVIQFDIDYKNGKPPLGDDTYIILGIFYPERLFEIENNKVNQMAKQLEKDEKDQEDYSDPTPNNLDFNVKDAKSVLDIEPWFPALNNLLESLAIELADLDRFNNLSSELIEAYDNARNAELEVLHANYNNAIRLYKNALGVLRKEKHYHAAEKVVSRYVAVALLFKKTEHLISVASFIDDQIAAYEKLMARLNPREMGRFQSFKVSDYLLRRQVYHDWLSDIDPALLGNYSQVPVRQFVLAGDGMRLRPMRHEIQLLGEVHDKNLKRNTKRLLGNGANALEMVKSNLKKAQQEGHAREEYRTGNFRQYFDIINKAQPGDVIIKEAAEPSRQKNITYESGPYAQLLVKTRELETELYTAIQNGTFRLGNTGIVENWQQIVKGMKQDEVIVSYFDYGQDRPLYAAIISHTGDVQLIDLPFGTLPQVRDWIEQGREELATDATQNQDAIQKLSESLWFPLGKLPRKVTIIPTLSLLGFPFEVLKSQDGTRVVESHDIQYALGLSVGVGRARTISDTLPAIVIGAHTFKKQGLDPLPSSRAEVTQIRNYLSGIGIRLYPNNAFPDSPQEWVDIDKKISILHVSTHAIWDKSNSLFDTLVFPEKNLLAVEMAFSPIKADLVIFSACNVLTKRADVVHPLSGLVTGALSSAAPQLITSLWSISASGSSVFMEVFYRKLFSLKDPAAALAETKSLFINTKQLDNWLVAHGISLPPGLNSENLKHSYYWAPYILLVRSE